MASETNQSTGQDRSFINPSFTFNEPPPPYSAEAGTPNKGGQAAGALAGAGNTSDTVTYETPPRPSANANRAQRQQRGFAPPATPVPAAANRPLFACPHCNTPCFGGGSKRALRCPQCHGLVSLGGWASGRAKVYMIAGVVFIALSIVLSAVTVAVTSGYILFVWTGGFIWGICLLVRSCLITSRAKEAVPLGAHYSVTVAPPPPTQLRV